MMRDAAPPVLIDEWQRLAWVWDEVRQWVDRDPSPGRFILTGSAAPTGTPIHSGAGRILSLRMRPLCLVERGLAEPRASLTGLLGGSVQHVTGTTDITVADYVHEIAASGLPGIRGLSALGRQRQLDGYLGAVVAKEVPEQGLMVRRPAAMTAWLRAYALATGGTASYTTILDAATPGSGNKPSKSTTLTYRDALAGLWLTDPVPAWVPVLGRIEAPLAKAPKHFLADPALAVRLLGLSEADLLPGPGPHPLGPQAGTLLGRLFEALIAQSLHTYAAVTSSELSHLRTANGAHEVDFVVTQGADIVGIEVKLATAVTSDDVRHLNWLESHYHGGRVTKVCLTTGSQALTRSDGVHVIPAALLGP
jgi:predicted AAA+ superfamily ATPase